jgi:hypothetical protein
MPELRDAAGIGTSEVEGSRARDARPGAGWTYYPQTAQELQKCIAAKPKPKPKCTLENTVLGLCAEK